MSFPQLSRATCMTLLVIVACGIGSICIAGIVWFVQLETARLEEPILLKDHVPALKRAEMRALLLRVHLPLETISTVPPVSTPSPSPVP